MPRPLDPLLRELLERENPRVDIEAVVSVPDVGMTIRRAEDQFFTIPPLVAGTLFPSGALVASPTGGLQLAASSARLAQQESAATATDIRPFPRDKHLKTLGWRVDPAFDRVSLRAFQARVQRTRVGGLGPFPRSRLQLQIYRANGIAGRLKFENGTEKPRIEWSFVPLLNPPPILTATQMDALFEAPVGSSQFAWASFDLSNYGLVLSNSMPRGSADIVKEPPVYYFELVAIDIPPTADNWWRWVVAANPTSVTTVAGVGTFQRTWWERPNPETDEWGESRFLDCNLFRLDVDEYNPAGGFAEAVYAIDLGRVPVAASSGRVIFERSEPAGTQAILAISTAGSGGPWTTVSHEGIPTLKQQTYHLRVRLFPSPNHRTTPTLFAWGVEFKTPIDVSLEADPQLMPTEVGPPFLESSIGEGKITLVRTGRRDYADAATLLGTRYAPGSLDVEMYLGSKHPAFSPARRFLLERSTVSTQDPADVSEALTTLSYAKKAKRKIPAPLETINTVHTVLSGATTQLVRVTPVLIGATDTGNEYDGQSYYIRVRKSSVIGLEVGRTFTISGSSQGSAGAGSANQLDFTGTDELPELFAAGDEIEVHSARSSQPVIQWADEDPADAWMEVLTLHIGIPRERIGRGDLPRSGLPPRVTDLAPGDTATQDKLRITNRITEEVEGWAVLQWLSFLMGGATSEVGGQIVYRQIYPRRDANGVVTVAPSAILDPRNIFDPRDYFDPSTPRGLEERAPIVRCKYGVNYTAADPNAFPTLTTLYSDVDALDWHTQQDLEALGIQNVPDEIAAFCYNTTDAGLFLATSLAQMLAHALSTGMRLWTFSLREMRPDLVFGDSIGFITDRYTDFEPSFQTPIRGWNAYQLVIVRTADAGRRITGFMLGLIGNVLSLRGGPGTLQGPYAPIDMPADFAVSVEVQPTPQGGVLQLKSTVSSPPNPFLAEYDLSIRSRPVGATAWGAPGSQTMGRDGTAHTKADYNAEYEVTAIAVSSGGNKTGTPQVRTVSTSTPPAAAPTIGTAIAEATRIRFPFTWDANGKRMEVWYRLDATDPGAVVPQWKVGTKHPIEYHRDGGDSEAVLAIPGSTWWATVSFVFFNAWDDMNAAGIVTVKVQGATPTAPPDITTIAQTAGYPTGTVERIDVTMPGSIVNLDFIQPYRDGVAYGSPIARTAGAGAVQMLEFTGQTPGNTHQWKVKARSAAGIESVNFSNTVTATHPASTIPTPSISCGTYNISQQGFNVTITPAGGTPAGVTWHLRHSPNASGGPYSDTGEASTATTIFHWEEQQVGALTDHIKVYGTKAGWTQSLESASCFRQVPRLTS